MPELISQSEYARRRGVSRQAVNKAIKAGRITLVAGGKIDPEVADFQWGKNADPSRGANAPAQDLAPGGAARGARAPGPPADNTPAARTFQDARALRELYGARMARLDWESKAGSLIRLEDVKLAAYSAARRARDLLRQMADRLAPEVAGETDPKACHDLITKEVDRACRELSTVQPGNGAEPGGD